MNPQTERPGFGRGVLIAIALSALAGFLSSAGALLYPPLASTQVIVTVVAIVYIAHLLRTSAHATGRLVVIAAWLTVTAALWLWSPALAGYVVMQVLMIWLVRSLYFHRRLSASMLDLALTFAGLAAALWAAVHTGSLFMACWSFLLMQAGFVFIPGVPDPASPGGNPARANEAFERAHRQAEKAFQRLNRELP